MAEVVRYVDPDASGNADGTSWTDAYTSLSAWEAGERADLVTAGDWHHVYCRASSGTADTTGLEISASLWTLGASNYILIEAADGDQAVKTGWDTSRYRLSVTGDICIDLKAGYIRLKGIQVEGDTTACINAATIPTSDIRIDSCRIRDLGGSTNRGITINDADATFTVQNCIITGFPYDGIIVMNNTDTDIFQCVIYGCGYDGIEFDAGTGTITNCAVFNTSSDQDFDIAGGATVTIDHCASDDGDGTNSVAASGSDWTNEFSDPANGDFTLLNGGNCYLGGATITGGPSTDIDGDSWHATTPSIGADEYVSAGGAISASISGSTTLTANLTGTGTLSASTSGSATLSALLTATGALASQIAGTSTISATLEIQGVTGDLSAALSGSSTVSATIKGTGALTSLLEGISTASGTLTGMGTLQATAIGSSTLTAILRDANLTVAGEITISFTSSQPMISMTGKKAEITLSGSLPTVTFN